MKPIDIEVYSGAIAPVVTVTPDDTGVTITVTDNTGPHSAHVNHGAKGDTGETGPTGPQGETGATGATGAPFTIKKTYTSVTAMITDRDNMQVNDFVIIDTGSVQEPPTGELYMAVEISATHPTGWKYVVDMSGCKGDTGAQGPQGIPGQNGRDGVDGAKGDKGEKGVSITDIQMLEDGRLLFVFDGEISSGQTTKIIRPVYLPAISDGDIGMSLKVLRGSDGHAYWGKAY